MFFRCLCAVLLFAVLLSGAGVPPATFHGTVHGVSKKLITLENAEGNLIDFEINRKTHTVRGSQEISPEDLKTGDEVTIEARQEMGRFLVAVRISVPPPPKN